MSTLNEEFETLDPAEEVQKAYDNSAVSNWTIARHSAAMSMGASILSGVFGPELKALQDNGTYPNSLRDVVIVLWLLSLSPAEVIRINSRLNIDEAVAAAYNWAEIEGVKYGSASYIKGIGQLTEIVGSIFTSFYGIESTGKREPLRKRFKPAWQIRTAFYAIQAGVDYYSAMNIVPIAQLIQWGAQLAIDRGATIIYNASTLANRDLQEKKRILNR